MAADEINYRRFFDINELAAIRVEDPVVFEVVHELPLELARRGIVTGFRIDHVDGLYDPEKYLRDLQRCFRDVPEQDGQAPVTAGYVVVEKILSPGRAPARQNGPVHGTTGYEFLNHALGGAGGRRGRRAACASIALRDGGDPGSILRRRLREQEADARARRCRPS